MTLHHVLKIDFTEIPAIEVTCTECSALVSIPLARRNVRAHMACPGCNRQLWGDGQEKVYARVSELVRALSSWQEFQAADFRLGFSITSSQP